MIGRTLLQQAVPTTVGAMVTAWGTALDACVLPGPLPVSYGGAAGTMAAVHPHGPALRAALAAELDLPDPGRTWHADRTPVLQLAAALGVAAAVVGTVATDVVLLAQTEIGEVREAAPGGSSAMPHKQNAIAAITARAAAAQAPGLVATVLAQAPELQRGAGPWHAEWLALQRLLQATGGAASRLRTSLEGLSFDLDAVTRNLGDATPGRRPRGRSRRRLAGEPMTAVVLLPGIGTTQATWDAVASRLPGQVIRPEWRGHDGSSVAPGTATVADLGSDVIRAMDAAGIGQAHVVGLSLGGMVGLWLAAEHPGRISRLAVVCTNTEPDRAMFTDRAALVRAEGMTAVSRRSVDTWVAAPDPRLVAMVEAVDAEGYAQCCEAIAGLDLDLERVAAPALAVAGADDGAAPPAGMRALADRIGARFREVPGRHLPIVEHPRAVADLLLDHLVPNRGLAVRREILGDAHVDRALAATDALTADFQDFLTRYAWGEVWTRPGLGRRDRSLVTLGVLVALGAEAEIAMHVRAAIRNGLTAGELAEVLQHTALYAGLPRANAAFATARRVLAEMEDE